MENALIIFVQNLEKGKVKNRLAESIGDEKAIEVYQYLLQHTQDITVSCKYNLFVFYSHYIHINDVFDDKFFSKHLQEGNDAGEKMMNAFTKVFDFGHKNVCFITGDCYELQTEHLEEAFEKLHKTNTVIGPAASGDFYLLGMKSLYPDIFLNKEWETSSVYNSTVEAINKLGLSGSLLPQLNNVNTMEALLNTDILTKIEEENNEKI